MLFSYNLLQTFFTRKLPKPEKLAELLTLHSFEVSEVKKVKSDYALDVDVLPNRAGDCFSHIGVAREIAAILNFKFGASPTPDVGEIPRHRESGKTNDFVSVEVKTLSVCPRYTAKVIVDVKVGPSPKRLKDYLETCGLNSINNIVDSVNYAMLETGQPLHAFDGDKLAGGKIIVRFAKEGEKITTLDNQKFDLNPRILVIADAEKPVAIAGIKGGKDPEISDGTKTILLESANFNPTIIRKASRDLGLKTDASLRFEHGIDPNLTEYAINRAVQLIQKVAGGIISKNLIDIYPKKVYPVKIKLDFGRIKSLLGAEIPKTEIKKILKNLGFKIKNYIVEAPTFRLDVSIQEDLIEEIGRIYGYDKILPVFPIASLIPPKRNDDIFWENQIRDIFKEIGFTEAYNYSFQKDPSTGSGQDPSTSSGSVEVGNPTSLEYRYLRPSLIPNLLRNIEKNKANFSKIKIFEIGKIFTLRQAQGEAEKRMISGVVMGGDFYQLKGAIDALFDKLGIAKVWYDDYKATPEDSPGSLWKEKKSAEIKVGSAEVGFLGELKDDPRFTAFDLDFERLKTLAMEDQAYRPISKYPATIRDLAVLVPVTAKVEEVLNIMETVGGDLVVDIDLFDMYEGEEISDGQKNLAFHIIYQAQDRTLTSIDVYKIHQNIIKALEENPTWQVRK